MIVGEAKHLTHRSYRLIHHFALHLKTRVDPGALQKHTFLFYDRWLTFPRGVFSAVRDGTSSQCEVPRDLRFPECLGKVDVSVPSGIFSRGDTAAAIKRDVTTKIKCEDIIWHTLALSCCLNITVSLVVGGVVRRDEEKYIRDEPCPVWKFKFCKFDIIT